MQVPYGDTGGGPPDVGLARLRQLVAALKRERSSWDDHWREIARYQMPRFSRFDTSDTNEGKKKHGHVYDNTAIYAARTLAAGMMSGVTSPARPWFRLGLRDKDLLEHGPVKTWLHDVEVKMRAVFAASNTYHALHKGYTELGLFGTWADIVLPNYDTVIHHYPLTIGQYCLATDEHNRVNLLVRDVRMTVGQMVAMFGEEHVSSTVRDLYRRGQYTVGVDVVHVIEPRRNHDWNKFDVRNMPYASIWFEPGRTDGQDKPLRVSGFRRFRALTPRWLTVGEDVYGVSPGMDALGDVKQLQFVQSRKAQAIDYKLAPPLQVPTTYKDSPNARMPGGIMYVDSVGPQNAIRPAFDVNFDLQHALMDIADTRERIRSAYYADLFLMLASQPANGRMTATEVAERHEEKLLMLGPVLENLHNELLAPLIDITFDELREAGALPPPPPELEGADLDVEFISVLAQAQRAVGIAGTERVLTTAIQLGAVQPQVLDKIDFDQVIDEYADAFGVNPKVIVPDDKVAEIREERRAAMQAQQTAAAMPQTVDSAKTASEIDTQNLRDVLGTLQGYISPSPPFVR